PTAGEESAREGRLGVLDLRVVQVDAALGDRAPGVRQARAQPGVDEGLHDGRLLPQLRVRELLHGGGEGRRVELGEIALPEEGLRRGDDGIRRLAPVHEARDLTRERALRLATERLLAHLLLKRLDLLAREEGEDLEPRDDV